MKASSSLVLLLLASGSSAQVPDGYYVVSTFTSSGRTPGGLFIADPRVGGNPASITGLNQDLTGAGLATGGANCVAIRRLDGMLLVGELGLSGTQIDLHVILLRGTAVANDVTFNVGVVDPSSLFGGGINQMAILPNQDVLVGVSDLAAQAPLNGSLLGIVSTFRNTVTPVPISPGFAAGSGVNAIAADAAGTTAYFAVLPRGQATSAIYAVAIPGGGAPRLITTLTGVSSIAVDRFGQLIVTQITGPGIYSVDPANGNTTLVGTVGSNPNGMNLERATDNVVYVLNGFGPQGPGVFWMTRGGASTLLTNALTGVPSDVDVNHDPWDYGSPTPGTRRYAWLVEANPGGLPQIGNSGFGLSVRSTSPGGAAGVFLASLAPASINVSGLEVLVNPARIFFTGLVPASGDIALPLPNDPSLPGGLVFFQSLHLDAGGPLGLAATQGVRVAILR